MTVDAGSANRAVRFTTLHRLRAGRLALYWAGLGLAAAACGGENPLPPPPPPPPNQAPQTVGAIPPQSVNTGETATLDVAAYFRDPDGGALTYTAATSNPAVVSVAVSGSSLTLVGVGDGQATVTVTAADPGGLTAAQSVAVTVQTPNRAPETVGSIPAQSVNTGQTTTLDVASYFRDPDGDALGYAAATSAAGVVSVSMSGSVLTMVGVADGTATVTVTASDPGGLTAAQSVSVTVQTPNRAPETVGTIPARSLEPGRTETLDAASYFRDPDGDALTYTAATSNAAVVSAAMSGSSLTLTGVAPGTATVTVTARDPGGLTAAQNVPVSVSRATAPDLVWVGVDRNAITVAPGSEGVVEFTVGNAGDAASSATNSRAHESSDPTITTSDRVASEAIAVEALAPGATATVRLRISVPAGAPTGSTYFGMCVDPVTGETNTANNCSSAVRLTISASNRAPRPQGTVPARSLAPGQTASVDLSAYFTDPDGDALSYTAASSAPAVAAATVSGRVLTIRAVASGTATITATARDPGGLTATQRVAVTVTTSNRAPQPVNAIPAQSLAAGQTASVNLASYFTDPDGDALVYAATSSNAAVAGGTVSGSVLTIRAVAQGTATITATARDPGRLTATQSVPVSVVANLTNNSADDSNPAWSPDGARIAFDSDRDGDGEIYVMNADGTGVVNLTNNSAFDGLPTWSSDGTKVAFVSGRDPGNPEIYAMNADGTGAVNLTNDGWWDSEPAWSPDGSKIAFRSSRDGNSEIYVMNADGSGVTRLTNNSATDGQPAWSPDGARISFWSTRDGGNEVFVMNADGTGVTNLTNNSDGGGSAWSPDGTRIAFSSNRDGNGEIYVMNADGTGARNLTNNSAADYEPTWSPDGTRIAFRSSRDGNNEIYVLTVPASTSQQSADGQPRDRGSAGTESGRGAASNPLPEPSEEPPVRAVVRFRIVVESVEVRSPVER